MLRPEWWRRRLRFAGRLWVALVLAVLVFAGGTAGAVVFHKWWDGSVSAQNADRLERSVAARVSRVKDGMTRYLDALRAVGALVQSSTGAARTTGAQFESFARGLHPDNRYTAMRSLGWQVPVTRAGVTDLAAKIRRDGQPGYTIRPPGARTEYAPLVYQYRLGSVASRPGDDRRADPAISAVLDRTRDSGEPGLVPAPDARDRQAGDYLLFLPIYQAFAPARASLLGWVSAQIHADGFLTEALSGIAPGNAGVQLVDIEDHRPIAADPDGFQPSGPYARTSDVTLAGRVWRLYLTPLPNSIVIQSADPTATLGLLGGIALSLLLAVITVMLAAQAETARALRTANNRSADMVAMLSHDARQPLTTIINYSQLVLDDLQDAVTHVPAAPAGAPDARLRGGTDIPHSLGRVIGAAHRLNHLVDDVLTTARLDAIPTHNARPVLIDQIINEAVSDSGADGMLIDTTAVQPAWAYTDPTHLRQIVANLIGNALKYGAPPVTISTAVTDGVIIEVTDNGPGVPAEFIGRLFDRFTRATTVTNKHGSGLGLYIVQRLAEVNGGHVTYTPRQPTGACFTLTLPAASADGTVADADQVAATGAARTGR